jgi:LmbE family N-acetylglucosaminyl deacetylase
MENMKNIYLNADRVLVIAPHPDDEIIGCGGSMLWHSRLKHEITCCYLTDGSKGYSENTGSEGLTEVRRKEAEAVIGNLKSANALFWGVPDLELTKTDFLVSKMKELLRRKMPSIIFAPSPWEKHPDHHAAFEIITEAACYLAEEENLAQIYICFYSVWDDSITNSYIDITDCWTEKEGLLKLYKSQEHYRILELSESAGKLASLRNHLQDLNIYAENFLTIKAGCLRKFNWNSFGNLFLESVNKEGELA